MAGSPPLRSFSFVGGSSSQSPAVTDAIRSAKSRRFFGESAKSSRPESARSCIERCKVGGSVRGENPSRFVRSSAKSKQDSGFRSCLSHSSDFQGLKYLPRVQCDPRAEGDAVSVSLIARIACPRGCSSAGRAPALQAGGQRFESAHLHQHIDNRIGLSRSPECRKAISGSSFLFCRDPWSFLQRLKSGYRSNKLVRVRGGCLGTKSRRKTRLPAISVGELEANDDPAVSEWGNPLEVMLEHPWLNT